MATAATPDGDAKPFRFAMLLPTLIVDVIAPIALFKLLEWRGVSVLWAIAVSGLPPLLNNLRMWIRFKRLEPLGILTFASIAIGTIATLVSKDVFYTLVKDSFLTGAIGLVFAGSLLTRRPLMFHIVGQLLAGDNPSRRAAWDEIWTHPVYRNALRLVTGVWALAYLADAFVRVVLAKMLPPAQVMAASPVMGFIATGLVIWFTRAHLGQARKRLEQREQFVWPL
jgi:hypothetical protein